MEEYGAMYDRRRFPRFESTIQMKYGPEGNDKRFSYTIAGDISKGGIRMPALSGIVNKGDLVMVDGRPDVDAYMSNEGEAKANLIVIAEKWKVLK